MATATIRLTSDEKRRYSAEARRRGITLSEFLREAARKAAEAGNSPWLKFFAKNPPADFEAPADLSTREGFSC
jgi:hypothetical protein